MDLGQSDARAQQTRILWHIRMEKASNIVLFHFFFLQQYEFSYQVKFSVEVPLIQHLEQSSFGWTKREPGTPQHFWPHQACLPCSIVGHRCIHASRSHPAAFPFQETGVMGEACHVNMYPPTKPYILFSLVQILRSNLKWVLLVSPVYVSQFFFFFFDESK